MRISSEAPRRVVAQAEPGGAEAGHFLPDDVLQRRLGAAEASAANAWRPTW